VDDAGQGISYFAPVHDSQRSNNYELYFDKEGTAFVVRAIDVVLLKRGKARRILAADISRRALTSISQKGFATWRSWRNVGERPMLDTVVENLSHFVSHRDVLGPPYYGALRNAPPMAENRKATPFGGWSAVTVPSGSENPTIFDGTPGSPLIRHAGHIAEGVTKDLRLQKDPSGALENAVVFYYRIAEAIAEEDLALIGAWKGQGSPPNISILQDRSTPSFRRMAPLINARLAERSVIEYLRSCGIENVRDVSLGQIQGTDQAWKTHDIEAGRPIDVKNTTIFRENCRQTYVDRLKAISATDVAIAGVATRRFPRSNPYDKKGRIRQGALNGPDIYQIYLGEMTSGDLVRAKRAVNTLTRRECAVDVQVEDKRYPYWVFELKEATPDYQTLYRMARPLATTPSSILTLALAAGAVQDEPLYRRLNDMQRAFIASLQAVISEAGFSKKAICLFIFSEFMNAAIRGEDAGAVMRFARTVLTIENFTSTEYFNRQLKTFNPRGWISPFDPKVGYHGSSSGGLYDPYRSVPKLLDLLGQCGEAISRHDERFVSFDAMNAYILLGKTKSGKKLTIYAYCGGKLLSGVDCDAFPLSIATNRSCGSCGKLVCTHCGYCSHTCSPPETDRDGG